MKYTKEDLENLQNDPMLNRFAKMFGLDLNNMIEEAKQFTDSVHSILDDMVKEGTLKCEEKTENGVTTRYYRPVEKHTEELKEEAPDGVKKEYVKPESKTQPFVMNASQLEKFINTYRELIEAEKKLSYLYGIEFTDGDSGFGFPNKINEIVWNFVRIIFGDENAEDIADYVFGTSNFDNVKSLYDELT